VVGRQEADRRRVGKRTRRSRAVSLLDGTKWTDQVSSFGAALCDPMSGSCYSGPAIQSPSALYRRDSTVRETSSHLLWCSCSLELGRSLAPPRSPRSFAGQRLGDAGVLQRLRFQGVPEGLARHEGRWRSSSQSEPGSERVRGTEERERSRQERIVRSAASKSSRPPNCLRQDELMSTGQPPAVRTSLAALRSV